MDTTPMGSGGLKPPMAVAPGPSQQHDDKRADARTEADVVVVEFDRTAGGKVGMGFWKGGSNDREVQFIQKGSLLDAWNEQNPQRAIAAGD